MAASIYTPPFELVNLEIKHSETLNRKLEMIFLWLMGKKPQGKRAYG